MAWVSRRELKQLREVAEVKGYYEDPTNIRNEYLKQLYGQVGQITSLTRWNFDERQNRQRMNALFATSKRGNGTVYSIVSRLAGACGELSGFIELLDKNNKKIESHWVLDLLNNPNDIDTRASLYESLGIHILTVGDGFLYGQNTTVNITGQKFRQLMVMPAHEVEIVHGGLLAPIKGFKLMSNTKIYGNSVPELSKDNVMFIRLPNPSSQTLYGLSPLTTVLADCDVSDIGKLRMRSTMQNGGKIRVITPYEGEFPDPLTDGKDLETEFVDKHESKKTIILKHQIAVHELGDSASDMELLDSMLYTIKRICNNYNFPIDLLEGQSSYANQKEAKALVYTLAIRYVNIISEGLTKFLGLTADGMRLKLNTDQIEELKPDNTAAINTLVTMGSSINERRDFMGYAPVEGGDVVLIPMGVAPLSDMTTPIDLTEKELPKDIEE